MIGIPGQTYESLAGDIEIFRGLDLDMVGWGLIFLILKHPLPPENGNFHPHEEQVPNTGDDL
jgi:biotin synthase